MNNLKEINNSNKSVSSNLNVALQTKYSFLTLLIFWILFQAPLKVIAQEIEDEKEDKIEVQQFLFYLEEAYLQEVGEFQISLQMENWHFNDDLETPNSDEMKIENFNSFFIEFEYGIFDWLQLELELPYSSLSLSENHKFKGIGDVSAALGIGLWDEKNNNPLSPTISIGAEISFPTGEWSEGLGNGGYGLETGIKLSKSLKNFVFHFNGSFTKVFAAKTIDQSEDLSEVEFAAAIVYRATDKIDLIFESGLELEKENNVNETSSYLVPGIRYELLDSFEIGLGLPIIFSETENDYRIIFKMQYEW